MKEQIELFGSVAPSVYSTTSIEASHAWRNRLPHDNKNITYHKLDFEARAQAIAAAPLSEFSRRVKGTYNTKAKKAEEARRAAPPALVIEARQRISKQGSRKFSSSSKLTPGPSLPLASKQKRT